MNKVHLIDNMEFMKTIPDKYYELAIVDPPYGIKLQGQNIIKNKNDIKNFNTDWDAEIPSEKYFIEIQRISKSQIIWGGNYFLDYLGYCKAPIIWDKLNGKSIYADGEMAWTGGNVPRNLKIFRHQWCGAFKDSERGVVNIHPTQKPVALYKWLLQNYAHKGDKIFDSHVGSGSSRIACYDLGFDFEGCEIDKDYWQAQEERFKTHIQQQSLFTPQELEPQIYKQESLF